MMKKRDVVERPEHHNEDTIEVIDAMTIDAVKGLSIDEFRGYLTGNIIKYVFRAGHKEYSNKDEAHKAQEDLDKAIWYINELRKCITDA